MAETTQNVVQQLKVDWLKRHDGAVLYKDVNLGSPTIRHLYKRTYGQLGRNCHFISVFGRVLAGEKAVLPLESELQKRFKTAMKNCQDRVRASNAVIEQAGIEDTAEFTRTEVIQAPVIVPPQNQYLKIMCMADQYLILINTLWLEGEITDHEKSKAELEIKHILRALTSLTRKLRIYMQGKANEAQDRKSAASKPNETATESTEQPAAETADAGETTGTGEEEAAPSAPAESDKSKKPESAKAKAKAESKEKAEAAA